MKTFRLFALTAVVVAAAHAPASAQSREQRQMMADLRIRRLPVMKDDELVGILSIGDVAVAASSKRQVGQTLEQVSESPATMNVADGPARGTPERVRAAAREHERKG